jgi:methylated-DNA-[protein]-cysteine S-methyltransferase
MNWQAYAETPIGGLGLTGTDDGVETISFHADRCPTDRAAFFVIQQLDEYFRGERRTFDVPLTPKGTPFQLAVWHELLTIPYGETRTYAQIAQKIDRPAATRAVGAANGANPIPIIIPCHRVIGSSGKLTGFGGGLGVKRALLDLECGAELF